MFSSIALSERKGTRIYLLISLIFLICLNWFFSQIEETGFEAKSP